MKNDEMVKQFESQFVTMTIGEPECKNEHGEPYVAVFAGGQKSEGEPIANWFHSEDDAADAWLKTAKSLAKKDKHLYWRTTPKIVRRGGMRANYQIRARFVASNKAPKKKSAKKAA